MVRKGGIPNGCPHKEEFAYHLVWKLKWIILRAQFILKHKNTNHVNIYCSSGMTNTGIQILENKSNTKQFPCVTIRPGKKNKNRYNQIMLSNNTLGIIHQLQRSLANFSVIDELSPPHSEVIKWCYIHTLV